MIALLLVLASSPLDPLWALVDEERYEMAIAGALRLAQDSQNPETLRQKALSLAVNAACTGQANRCDEVAETAADWNPLWRPDSRAKPRFVQAFGRARLSRNSRHNGLPKGTLNATEWCAPSSAHELLLITEDAGISEQKRQIGACISLTGAKKGYLIAFNRELKPVAALGSPNAAINLQPQTQGSNQAFTIGAIVAGAALAVTATYFLLADPGSGELQLTIERRP